MTIIVNGYVLVIDRADIVIGLAVDVVWISLVGTLIHRRRKRKRVSHD